MVRRFPLHFLVHFFDFVLQRTTTGHPRQFCSQHRNDRLPAIMRRHDCLTAWLYPKAVFQIQLTSLRAHLMGETSASQTARLFTSKHAKLRPRENSRALRRVMYLTDRKVRKRSERARVRLMPDAKEKYALHNYA